jgi:hypothetical protein
MLDEMMCPLLVSRSNREVVIISSPKMPFQSAKRQFVVMMIDTRSLRSELRFPRFCGIVKVESILFQRENQDHAKSPKDVHAGV